MKLHLKESLNQTDIREEKTFSVFGDKATILVGNTDGFDVETTISAHGTFSSITELLITLTKYTQGELPIRLESFDEIEFSTTSSRLRMDYTTEAGEHKALVVCLYENPCWMSKNSLEAYGIYLKK